MRKCIECGSLITGRSDKLFCMPSCKSIYHYKKKKKKTQKMFVTIDKQLKQNRRLLRHFNHAGKSTIRKEKLLQAGFDPQFLTHYWKNSKGDVYLYC
jgi:predicted nucleic acid-binding Zn ribbon protein